MKFHYTDLEDCHTAKGVVTIIDVLRAFSTAAYAFSSGAKEIILASSVEEALDLKSQIRNSKVIGEVGGLPPAGFDFGNSPTQISTENLSGITLIQRTGAGTQGAVRRQNADATVQFVQTLGVDEVTFGFTGKFYSGGEEDIACAEYLEKLLQGDHPDRKPFIRRVYDSRDALQHLDPQQTGFPHSDLEYCTQIDKFDFAMSITRQAGKLTMRCVKLN
jgi:2-phosphosulfolactate phosphatase